MIQKIKDLYYDILKEMKKVTWPTKDELKESTTVVIVVCIIFAIFTWGIDLLITKIFKGIF